MRSRLKVLPYCISSPQAFAFLNLGDAKVCGKGLTEDGILLARLVSPTPCLSLRNISLISVSTIVLVVTTPSDRSVLSYFSSVFALCLLHLHLSTDHVTFTRLIHATDVLTPSQALPYYALELGTPLDHAAPKMPSARTKFQSRETSTFSPVETEEKHPPEADALRPKPL